VIRKAFSGQEEPFRNSFSTFLHNPAPSLPSEAPWEPGSSGSGNAKPFDPKTIPNQAITSPVADGAKRLVVGIAEAIKACVFGQNSFGAAVCSNQKVRIFSGFGLQCSRGAVHSVLAVFSPVPDFSSKFEQQQISAPAASAGQGFASFVMSASRTRHEAEAVLHAPGGAPRNRAPHAGQSIKLQQLGGPGRQGQARGRLPPQGPGPPTAARGGSRPFAPWRAFGIEAGRPVVGPKREGASFCSLGRRAAVAGRFQSGILPNSAGPRRRSGLISAVKTTGRCPATHAFAPPPARQNLRRFWAFGNRLLLAEGLPRPQKLPPGVGI